MVDETYGMTDPGAPVVPAVQPPSRAAVFMASAKGRWIIAGAAVAVLLVIVGVVLALFMMSTRPDTATPPRPPTAAGGSFTPTATVETTEEATPKVPISNADVFSFRDPFIALITEKTAPVAPTTPTTPSSSTSTTTDVSTGSTDANTLTLHDVVTEDGKSVAVLTLGSTEYRLSEGESITGTPWQVLDISGRTVIMLYGDDRISLSVGQALSK